MKRIHAFAIAAILLACQAASAADQKDFRDWQASCDNLRNCNAYGFDAMLSGSSYLRIERGGAPDAPVKITLATDANEGVTFTIRFNDPALPGLPDKAVTGKKSDVDSPARVVLTDTASADTLIASIRKAEKIIITRQDPADAKEKSDPRESEISMSGAAAALLWIDEQQKRLDTATALIRKGDRPASAVPPQPKPSVIVAAKPATDNPPAKPAPALIAKGRALCVENDEDSKLTETWSLGNDQFLYAFSCPNAGGANNYQYGFLVAAAGNPATARAVKFEWPIKIGSIETDPGYEVMASNPTFDAKTMTISSVGKGRALGDCGTSEDWVWDGKTFRLALLKMMGQCRAVPLYDWPTLYRAERK
jgi:hypothetical protein